jgi:hypothetical protein
MRREEFATLEEMLPRRGGGARELGGRRSLQEGWSHERVAENWPKSERRLALGAQCDCRSVVPYLPVSPIPLLILKTWPSG